MTPVIETKTIKGRPLIGNIKRSASGSFWIYFDLFYEDEVCVINVKLRGPYKSLATARRVATRTINTYLY